MRTTNKKEYPTLQLSDEEVIKAWECLAYCKECSESEACPYYMDNGNTCDNISLAKDTLQLLNHREVENERLGAEPGNILAVFLERLKKKSFVGNSAEGIACMVRVSDAEELVKELMQPQDEVEL